MQDESSRRREETDALLRLIGGGAPAAVERSGRDLAVLSAAGKASLLLSAFSQGLAPDTVTQSLLTTWFAELAKVRPALEHMELEKPTKKLYCKYMYGKYKYGKDGRYYDGEFTAQDGLLGLLRRAAETLGKKHARHPRVLQEPHIKWVARSVLWRLAYALPAAKRAQLQGASDAAVHAACVDEVNLLLRPAAGEAPSSVALLRLGLNAVHELVRGALASGALTAAMLAQLRDSALLQSADEADVLKVSSVRLGDKINGCKPERGEVKLVLVHSRLESKVVGKGRAAASVDGFETGRVRRKLVRTLLVQNVPVSCLTNRNRDGAVLVWLKKRAKDLRVPQFLETSCPSGWWVLVPMMSSTNKKGYFLKKRWSIFTRWPNMALLSPRNWWDRKKPASKLYFNLVDGDTFFGGEACYDVRLCVRGLGAADRTFGGNGARLTAKDVFNPLRAFVACLPPLLNAAGQGPVQVLVNDTSRMVYFRQRVDGNYVLDASKHGELVEQLHRRAYRELNLRGNHQRLDITVLFNCKPGATGVQSDTQAAAAAAQATPAPAATQQGSAAAPFPSAAGGAAASMPGADQQDVMAWSSDEESEDGADEDAGGAGKRKAGDKIKRKKTKGGAALTKKQTKTQKQKQK